MFRMLIFGCLGIGCFMAIVLEFLVGIMSDAKREMHEELKPRDPHVAKYSTLLTDAQLSQLDEMAEGVGHCDEARLLDDLVRMAIKASWREYCRVNNVPVTKYDFLA